MVGGWRVLLLVFVDLFTLETRLGYGQEEGTLETVLFAMFARQWVLLQSWV